MTIEQHDPLQSGKAAAPALILKFAVLVAAAVLLLSLAYSYFIEPFRLVIKEKTIAVEGWEPEFNDFRAVLISDIHGGSRGGDAESIKRIVNAANEQNADAIFLLGDYVSQQRFERKTIAERPLKMPISEIANLLSGLRARYGVFAVLGNHDGWYNGQKVTAELSSVGINVLDGKLATIERNGRSLRILGLRDHQQARSWREFSNEARSILDGNRGAGNIIVLEHSPDVLEMITGELAISNEMKLMFAGHTHGGQVWLPILGYPIVPSSYGQKYAAGSIRDRGLDLFVTTGTGTSVLPFRFLVPPEIAVITVRVK